MKIQFGPLNDPYNVVQDAVLTKLGFDTGDILVEMLVNGEDITEILIFDEGNYVWRNHWWKGETDIQLIAAAPVSELDLTKYWGFDEEG